MRTSRRPIKGWARAPRDRWLVAYADMVTLLFACFVSLYAARLNFVKPVAAGPASLFDLAGGRLGDVPTQPGPQREASLAGTDLWKRLDRVVKQGADTGALELRTDARGLVLSLPEAGSFPTGRADLSRDAERVLLDLAHVLRDAPGAIRVEGHTDDVPMHTPGFGSNWELSTARATRVVQLLIERGGIVPSRLSAAGYAEFRPVHANDSPAARARNRRVDIVVLNAATDAAQEPRPMAK